jgi:predicted ribosome quality control (RQC) complex YloA/Tae2 family protein
MDQQKIIEGIYLKDFAEQNKSWVDYFVSLNEVQQEECFNACYKHFSFEDLSVLKGKGLIKDEYFKYINSLEIFNYLMELQSKYSDYESDLRTIIFQQEQKIEDLVSNLQELQRVLLDNFNQIEYIFNKEHPNNNISLASIYSKRLI